MPVLIKNKRVHFDYEVQEKFDAGIELFGYEVKSVRQGHGSLAGAYISVRKNEAYLVGANIPPYQPLNTPKDYNPKRDRKLLLTKKEIARLSGVDRKGGLTVAPLSVYNKGRKLKLEFAIVRGKKKYDKRNIIKERLEERDIRRTLKRKY